jgi:para-nitrobenzyl esterase
MLCLLLGGCSRGAREPVRVVDPASQRETRAGTVVGFVGEYESHVWLGIPFAQPPVGDLRWRAPRPPEPWTGTREALKVGSACVQYGSVFAGAAESRPGEMTGNEDCLYLNVYAPRMAPRDVPSGAATLPVMLWIHGGGNTIGEGGTYNGGNLATTHKVVVVTANYRLGPFGWFRHAALRDDATDLVEASGNFGTLDHIRALEWVRDNIAAFGGNPQNVTIFGESAGGRNVFALLLSARARGLFHRAIVQSGGINLASPTAAEHFVDDAEPGETNSSAEMLVQSLIADRRAADRAAAKTELARMDEPAIARYLHSRSAAQILTAYPTNPTGLIEMPDVFADGTVLPSDAPLTVFARGGYNQVPVMIGTNRDENKLFMVNDPRRVRRILWLLPRLRDERTYNLSAEYGAKMWKATGADEPAAAMRATQGPSVYVYRWDWDEEPTILGADLSVMVGAAHAFEIPFVFGHFDLGRQINVIFTDANAPGRKALSAQMMSYWAQFAYDGSPASGRMGDLPRWTAWDDRTPSSPKFMVLDTPAGGGVRMSNERLTAATVLAAVDEDPRLATQRDRCMIYRELAQWSRGFSKTEYAAAGRNGCAEFPFDQYPWAG